MHHLILHGVNHRIIISLQLGEPKSEPTGAANYGGFCVGLQPR
jgi:hypothetical protein